MYFHIILCKRSTICTICCLQTVLFDKNVFIITIVVKTIRFPVVFLEIPL